MTPFAWSFQRTPARRDSVQRKVRAVRFELYVLTATCQQTATAPAGIQLGEYVRITDIYCGKFAKARYSAHRHYASCADPTNCTLLATDGGATGAGCSSSSGASASFTLAIPVGILRSFRYAGRQFAIQQQNSLLFTDNTLSLAGKFSPCSALRWLLC
ncbi:hypothetical protein KCP74_09335 [Salmonella enterica subsp. enterica]|nr:hypothetical protein KCP74_09335 [Salmonella enterica subsp. enterica]